VRIGIGLNATTLDAVFDELRAAQEAGLSSAWLSQIFGLDAITALSVAAHQIQEIDVGTFVVPTFPRHPTALAQQALTAQVATGNRFLLGIGLSHQVVIESMFGLSFTKPARHMREYLAVLMPLLHEGTVAFDGEVFKVHASIDRMDAAPPAVIVAALGPVMLQLAGEVADGTATWMTGPATLETHIVPTITEAAARAGRPAPRIVASLPICVTADVDGARERAARVFAVYGGLPSYRAMMDREGVAGPPDLAIAGDEDDVVGGIEQLAKAGVTDFVATVFGNAEERGRTTAVVRELARAYN